MPSKYNKYKKKLFIRNVYLVGWKHETLSLWCPFPTHDLHST